MRKCIVLLIYGIAIVSGFGQTPEKDQLGSKIDFFEFGISSDSFIVSNQALSFECAKFLGISKLSGVNLVPVNYQKNVPIKLYQVEAFRGSDTFNLALVLNDISRKGAFFDLNEVGLLEKQTGYWYLYGVHFSRNYGYFKIYSLYEDMAINILDSSNLCEKDGLFVRNADLDCYCFSPNSLTLSLEDVNQDGCVDFVFSGVQQKFCRGLEQGIGRLDSDPVEEIPVKIVFASIYIQDKDIWSWILYNESICRVIHR